MKERNKPTKSFIARSIEEIEKEALKKGYEAGFAKACELLHDFVFLVYQMREMQGDHSILNGRITYKVNNGIKVDKDEYLKHAELMNQMVALEDKVDTWIRENYNYFETDYEED